VGDVLYDLFALVATEQQKEEMTALYRRGGFGYGDIKKALAEAAEKYWAEPRARRAELAAKPEYVKQVLADGAAVARKKSAAVLKRVQDACGVTGW
jgi:tryptophanyl-tRNA synthetase